MVAFHRSGSLQLKRLSDVSFEMTWFSISVVSVRNYIDLGHFRLRQGKSFIKGVDFSPFKQ